MMRNQPPRLLLYAIASVALAVFLAGTALGVLGGGATWQVIGSVVLVTLGASILFPVVVSLGYDKLRERWLGDEVWRLFGELADAGIVRVYRDREYSMHRDNAQTRLEEEFLRHDSGVIYMMGPTLRVFFNPLGPFFSSIVRMLRSGGSAVEVRALIERNDSPCVWERTAIEEPDRADGQKPQTERDAESTVASIRALNNRSAANGLPPQIGLRRFMPAPYCTVVIFPSIAFYSPNLLSPVVPVRLPMILFRSGSHGYSVLQASFEHLWQHSQTVEGLPE